MISREEEARLAEARKNVDKIKKFYKNIASWAGTSFFLVAIDLFMNHGITWSRWPVFFWTIAIAIQAIHYIRIKHTDKEWEDRMIRKQVGRLPSDDLASPEDYSEDLLRSDISEKEKATLSDFRSVKKPWNDKDLV